VVATALWLVAAGGASALQFPQASQGWWEQYLPVVYLQAGIGAEEVDALKEEMEGWSAVSSVEVEDEEVSFARLEEALGVDEVREMGVSVEMMPVQLVGHPQVWRPGQVEIIARVEAMEMRDIVVEVDAPKAGALSWIQNGRIIASVFAVVVVLALLGALFTLGAFLRRLQEKERREYHLLEVFGASSAALRRPNLWRGMGLGTVAGGLAGMAFLPWSLSLDRFVAGIAGVGALPDILTALCAVALLPVGLFFGGLVGWISSRRSRARSPGKMEGLLDWERE
jgi:cell division protein FtsX